MKYGQGYGYNKQNTATWAARLGSSEPLAFDADYNIDLVDVLSDLADIDDFSIFTRVEFASALPGNAYVFQIQLNGNNVIRMYSTSSYNLTLRHKGSSGANHDLNENPISADTIYRFVGNISVPNGELFTDGISSETSGVLDAWAGAPVTFFIGSNQSEAQLFRGIIYEFGIWDGTLSAGNISDLQAGNDPTTVNSGNLVGYWENNGTLLWPDESGNGNNAVLNPI